MNNNKLKVLIVGGGMYVSGRGSDNYGTIFPAVLVALKKNIISDICVVTTNLATASYSKKSFTRLAKKMGVEANISYFPKSDTDKRSYIKAAKIFKPDVAIISVPDHLHSKICISLMNLKIHCLIVKPLTTNIIDAKKMIKIKNKHNLICEVEFHKRYDQANKIIKDKINNNDLGELQYAVIEYSQQKKIPTNIFKNWSAQSNIFQYLGVHYVDLIYWITKFKPISVTAWGQKEYLKKNNINTWDSIQATIKWKKNNKNYFVSSHFSNWIDPNNTSAMSDQKISIIGTKGRIFSDQKNRGLQLVLEKDGVKDLNPYFTSFSKNYKNNKLEFSGYGIDSIISYLDTVINFINNNYYNSKERPSFEQALYSTAILEACKKSLNNNNKTINIKL